MFRKIALFLFVVLVALQFFHPKKNKATGIQPYYIGKVYAVPGDVKSILEKACNDCHSNNTRYPWYCNFQSVDWWTTNHVNDGKRGLNFDEYINRPLRYQFHKLEELMDQVKENKMPLNSYTWIHKDAILTTEEKATITGWANDIRDSMKAKYPIDSLVRKKP